MKRPQAPGRRLNAGRRRFLGLAAAGAASGLAGGRASALCGLYPAAETLEFRAERQGEPAGWHRIAFLRQDGDLLVRSESELDFGRGESLRQRVEETWQDGWLVALASDTWRGGEHHRLRGERVAGEGAHGGGLAGQADRLRFNVSGYVVPTTFWHRDTPFVEVVFSVVDGLTKVVASQSLKDEALVLDGRPVKVRGWQLRGEWNCVVWYDEACTLAQVALPSEEGDTLLLRRWG